MKSFLTFVEALKGKQHKLDVDKDGKIEGEDLAKLRTMKKEETEIEEQAPAAPVPDKKYIKGTAEYKAYMATKKTRVGHPTNVKEEAEQLDEVGDTKKGQKLLQKVNKRAVERLLSKKADKDPAYARKAMDTHLAADSRLKEDLTEATVKTQKYSWGTMKTVHHGADFSIPLHPEHHQEIAKLKDEQEHKFKDETGRHWTARRKGEDVHFHSGNDGPKTVVKHSALKEETIEEKKVPQPTGDLKDACWKGYTAVGMKMKNGKKVPNCVPEGVELEEKMNLATAKMGDVIKDFQKSDAPQFAGKSKEKRREMAIAAKLGAERGVKEEVEQIDEISKSTLGSYVKKASLDMANRSAGVEKDLSAAKSDYNMMRRKGTKKTIAQNMMKKDVDTALSKVTKVSKRMSGIEKATDRLTREEVEQIDEISLVTKASYIEKAKKQIKDLTPWTKKGEYKDIAKNIIKRREKGLAMTKEEVKPATKPATKPPFSGPYKKSTGDVKDKSGAVHTVASRAKHLAKVGMKNVNKEEVEKLVELSTDMLKRYKHKATDQASAADKAGDFAKSNKRFSGIVKATNKQFKNETKKEELDFDNEGNFMPNPVSFKNFLNQLDEIKMADLPSRKITGRGYGTEYYKKEAEKDKIGYDDEKKEKSEVKRGRGRPVGSTSGARQKGSTTGKKRSGVEMTGYPLHLPNKN